MNSVDLPTFGRPTIPSLSTRNYRQSGPAMEAGRWRAAAPRGYNSGAVEFPTQGGSSCHHLLSSLARPSPPHSPMSANGPWSGSPVIPATACRSPDPASPWKRRWPAATSPPSRTFPRKSARRSGTTFGVSAFQIHFGSAEVATAGDELDVLVAMNPAALTTNIKDLRPGGTVIVDTGAFTERNLLKAGYAANPLENGSLSEFRVLPIDIGKLTEAAVAGLGLTSKQTARSRNMWALGLVLWMYGRDRQVTTDWLLKKFSDEPAIAERERGGAERRARLRGDGGAVRRAPPSVDRGGPGGARHVPDGQRHGSHRLGAGGRAQGGGARADGLRRVSDHSRLAGPAGPDGAQGPRRRDLPGRGRDRGHLRRHRRLLRRLARRHFLVGSGHRAQDRGDGARHRDRAAAHHRGLPARRAVHRPADQDRAVRPLPGRAGPQRGRPARGHLRLDAVGLFRRGHRGGPPRDQVHDAGVPPDRRVPGQRRRAVADSRSGHAADVPGAVPHRPRGLPALPAEPGHAGAGLGPSGHARSRAPDRRHRAERHLGQHLLRPGQPRHDDGAARRQDRRHRGRHSGAGGVAGRGPRGAGGGGLGLDVRADPHGGATGPGGGAPGVAHPPAVHLARSRATSASCSSGSTGSSCRK